MLLRIIGRLAYPIFAFMIAEGFEHSKNRRRYLMRMVAMAVLLQLVYGIVMKSLYQCIFVTFSLSIALCMVADNAMKRTNPLNLILLALSVIGVWFVTTILPDALNKTDFWIDYGFFGVMLPVTVFMAKTKRAKLFIFTVMLCFLWMTYGYVQVFALMTVPLIALYNGEKGKLRMKNFFYIFYPAHMVVIYLIKLLID